jgi:hypothetical protein
MRAILRISERASVSVCVENLMDAAMAFYERFGLIPRGFNGVYFYL